MSSVPRFDFSQQSTFESSLPKLQLQTDSSRAKGLAVPNPEWRRPGPLRTISTPPDSPTRQRASTMGQNDPKMLHDSGAITPPPTPTKTSHSKSSSANLFSSIGRIDSVSSSFARARNTSIDKSERPGSTQLKTFPYWLTDYEIADRKKPLGSGLWSDVYLAKPCLPKPGTTAPHSTDTDVTPPATPFSSRKSSISKKQIPIIPISYAIKSPASRSAKQVLTEEAKILSYLSRFPDAEKYIIPFHGQDPRTSALVLTAFDTTLETWIQDTLNTLPESERTQKIAEIFPSIAMTLIDGLIWMSKKGVTHADIKPSNILLNTSTPIPRAVYSDFSSAILILPSTSPTTTATTSDPTTTKPTTPLGGGTWDFLDPILLTSPSTSTSSPTLETETWSLALTLLYLIIGTSPYSSTGTNVFRRREMVKQGVPLQALGCGDGGLVSISRLRGVGVGIRVASVMEKWLGGVLVRDLGRRMDIRRWRAELERLIEGVGSGL